MTPVRLLGLSGSLRARSTNTALLRAAARAAPEGVLFTLYDGLGALPIFNPDVHPQDIPEVMALRLAIADADGLVVASPEYAHGIPGGLKNALDWLVDGHEFPNKPVTMFHASARAVAAPAALADVLRTMSARLCAAAAVTIPLLGRDAEAVETILRGEPAATSLRMAVASFVRFIGTGMSTDGQLSG